MKTNVTNRPRLFVRRPRAGDPLASRGMVDAINKLADAIENLEIQGGRIEWSNGRPRIIPGGS